MYCSTCCIETGSILLLAAGLTQLVLNTRQFIHLSTGLKAQYPHAVKGHCVVEERHSEYPTVRHVIVSQVLAVDYYCNTRGVGSHLNQGIDDLAVPQIPNEGGQNVEPPAYVIEYRSVQLFEHLDFSIMNEPQLGYPIRKRMLSRLGVSFLLVGAILLEEKRELGHL